MERPREHLRERVGSYRTSRLSTTTAASVVLHSDSGASSFRVGQASSEADTGSQPESSSRRQDAARNPAAPQTRLSKYSGCKRAAQTSRLYNLMLDINDLKQTIHVLTQRRQILEARRLNRQDDADGSLQKLIVEYFRVFQRDGVVPHADVVAFARSAMDEDISVNQLSGRDLILQQWRSHSALLTNRRLRCLSATVMASCPTSVSVKCLAESTGTITMTTLAKMFPHIMGRKHIDLVNKLIGKVFVGSKTYEFVLDPRTKKITQCSITLDDFGAFAKLLPNPFELWALFNVNFQSSACRK